ncbi:MAG: hypothetical protein C0592_02115 [Marinilabiliales bacterium]|nr:MAG: hypothetical protein C0592_02115 [Marinilabiliales bacterium]
MKRLLQIIIYFIVSVQFSYAHDYESIKDLCQNLEEKYSINIYFEDFPETTWEIGYTLADETNYEKLYTYILLFDEEFSKYPSSFIDKTNLEGVVFAHSLSISNQYRTAIPDYYNEILLLDFIRGDYNKVYQRHVIHHEFYHMIEEEFNGNAYWKDPEWSELNADGFKYGAGGSSVQGHSNVYSYTHPHEGFINLYSESAIEEDKAEMFATLFVKEEFDKLNEWIPSDAILMAKMDYMMNFLKTIDGAFSEEYWEELER